jgi:hypothetical protein
MDLSGSTLEARLVISSSSSSSFLLSGEYPFAQVNDREGWASS